MELIPVILYCSEFYLHSYHIDIFMLSIISEIGVVLNYVYLTSRQELQHLFIILLCVVKQNNNYDSINFADFSNYF